MVNSGEVGRVEGVEISDELGDDDAEDEVDGVIGRGRPSVDKDGRGDTISNCGSLETERRPMSRTS